MSETDKLCRESCQHAYWQQDPVLGGGHGQYNCPWKFGVTFAFAVRDGRRLCKHYTERKVGTWYSK